VTMDYDHWKDQLSPVGDLLVDTFEQEMDIAFLVIGTLTTVVVWGVHQYLKQGRLHRVTELKSAEDRKTTAELTRNNIETLKELQETVRKHDLQCEARSKRRLDGEGV